MIASRKNLLEAQHQIATVSQGILNSHHLLWRQGFIQIRFKILVRYLVRRHESVGSMTRNP